MYIVGILSNALLDFCKTLSCQKGFRGMATIKPAPQTASHQNQGIGTINTTHLSLGKVHRQNSGVNIFLRNAFGTQSLQNGHDYRLHLLGILTVAAPQASSKQDPVHFAVKAVVRSQIFSQTRFQQGLTQGRAVVAHENFCHQNAFHVAHRVRGISQEPSESHIGTSILSLTSIILVGSRPNLFQHHWLRKGLWWCVQGQEIPACTSLCR